MASRRHLRQRTCGTKQRHASRAAAWAAMQALACRWPSVKRLSVYECAWCSHWHVGHVSGVQHKGA